MILRKLLGPILSTIIMPAQITHRKEIPNHLLLTAEEKMANNLEISINTTPSSGNASINFIEYGTYDSTDIVNQKILIHAVGNNDHYEKHIGEYANEAIRYHCRVVGFNFRNVSGSEGTSFSEDDWVDDAIAVIDFYRNQGVPLENILLIGHSLGGAILTMAAARIYNEEVKKALKEGKEIKDAQSVKLINNRSFSNLTDEIIISLFGKIGSGVVSAIIFSGMSLIVASLLGLNALPIMTISSALLVSSGFFYEALPQNLLKPFLKIALWASFGTMDALSAYKSLPEAAKDLIMAKDDGVILKKASMYHGMKLIRSNQKKLLINQINTKSEPDLTNELLNIKDQKLVYSKHSQPCPSAHNTPLYNLHTYSKSSARLKTINGEQVMQNKIRRLLNI